MKKLDSSDENSWTTIEQETIASDEVSQVELSKESHETEASCELVVSED